MRSITVGPKMIEDLVRCAAPGASRRLSHDRAWRLQRLGWIDRDERITQAGLAALTAFGEAFAETVITTNTTQAQ